MRLVIRTLGLDSASMARSSCSLGLGDEVGGHRHRARRWKDKTLRVNIIPHTASVTSLGATGAGDVVNIDVDTIARHAARLSETRS